jgi:hypothetical protein
MMGWAVLAGRIVSDVVVSVTCMMCLEFIRDKKVQ